jgi:LysR family transcriptional regulator, glycine cleavage system transcriptional activator
MSAYPPLKALLALDSAIRLGSFALAAQELHVTPGAVGQQIQKLEEWLGVALFVRQIRQVTPTPEGRAYHAQIQPALHQIALASRRMRERRSNGVRLSIPPGFAAKWFAPRMADFLKAHPSVALNLTTSTSFVDFELDGIDLAIRHFDGHAPELDVHKLCDDEARLYCSPAYIREHGLSTPEDLLRATLLHNTLHPHWLPWLERYSRLTRAQIESIAGIQFDQSLIAIEAAVRGQGVVLTSAMLTEGECERGTLVEPFGLALPLTATYYVVHPASSALTASARALKDWLVTACGGAA